MKKVAIPVFEGKLSEFFGKCENYAIFELNDGNIINEKNLASKNIKTDKLPEWITEEGITDVIVYKMNKKIIQLFNNSKVNIFVGVSIDTPQKLISKYLNGNLKSDDTIIKEIINH
ncbi:MAG: hypothetical protein HN704_08515 [Bacteroidetes bacterium]|jgi:predicted Fe-Mo cluster-binding NifX family protein|nr:hypothetical protein [Bacteroidota bacterium]MBT6687441.1 hypothetical protein [Bacteroidota bacterium]MBT7143367.1 hypothetical protein [Bacteroidota bacterium]MBT7491635.1 hypothetical protein [Bacteroidota bacterium]